MGSRSKESLLIKLKGFEKDIIIESIGIKLQYEIIQELVHHMDNRSNDNDSNDNDIDLISNDESSMNEDLEIDSIHSGVNTNPYKRGRRKGNHIKSGILVKESVNRVCQAGRS